jgi:ABC-type nickel/cobalt efflux system permease component RcnA
MTTWYLMFFLISILNQRHSFWFQSWIRYILLINISSFWLWPQCRQKKSSERKTRTKQKRNQKTLNCMHTLCIRIFLEWYLVFRWTRDSYDWNWGGIAMQDAEDEFDSTKDRSILRPESSQKGQSLYSIYEMNSVSSQYLQDEESISQKLNIARTQITNVWWEKNHESWNFGDLREQ